MNLNDFLEEQLRDPEFVDEYEKLQPEMEVIRALCDARTSLNLTQQQLSKMSGIHQSDISKIEKGIRNPSVALLQRLADAMDMTLKIEFVPKKHAGL